MKKTFYLYVYRVISCLYYSFKMEVNIDFALEITEDNHEYIEYYCFSKHSLIQMLYS